MSLRGANTAVYIDPSLFAKPATQATPSPATATPAMPSAATEAQGVIPTTATGSYIPSLSDFSMLLPGLMTYGAIGLAAYLVLRKK